MFHLKLIYLLCFIAILQQQATARPIMRRMAAPLSNSHARNDEILKILDEYDYDLDTRNTDILTKPRNNAKNTLTFTTESKKQEKQLVKPPVTTSNDYSDYGADEDDDIYDASASAGATADTADGGIVNDNQPDDEEPSDLSKTIYLKKSRKSKSQKSNKKRESKEEIQRTTVKKIKYYDKTDHLSAEELDLVLEQLSLEDLRALSDFLDKNVIAEGTASFLESNLRTPYHYIIRMDEPTQLHHSYSSPDYYDNVKLQDSAIKSKRQLQDSNDEAYYRTTYRTKRQSFDENPKLTQAQKTKVLQLLTEQSNDQQNDEYLKLLAFSFPQDSRQKAGSDNEFTHLRVKRN